MTSGRVTDTKVCRSCGRVMTWRKAWTRTWDEVRYCSDACRRRRVSGADRELEEAIRRLLAERPRDATICPSEAARVVGGPEGADWRELLEPARRAARRLAADGEVEFTQAGHTVDPSRATGPVRLRLVRARGSR